jgi:four helix bundle protein
VRDFHKLKVWEKAHTLTVKVYHVTQDFPREEVYGLTNQMRRSCTSIPTNITEDYGRNSKAETVQFFNMAAGSSSELEYQLILAHDLQNLEENFYLELITEVGECARCFLLLCKGSNINHT